MVYVIVMVCGGLLVLWGFYLWKDSKKWKGLNFG